MELQEILEKTKKRTEKLQKKTTMQKIAIAVDDRPWYRENNTTPPLLQSENDYTNNQVQTGANNGCKRVQLEANGCKRVQKTEETGANGCKRVINGCTTGAKFNFSSLCGSELTVLCFIYEECSKNGSKTLEKITLEYICKSLGMNKNTIKSALKRLSNKNFIVFSNTKCGRGGWADYTISEEKFNEVSNGCKQVQTGANRCKRVINGCTTGASSPNNNNININNIIINKEAEELRNEYLKTSCLSEAGFSKDDIDEMFKALAKDRTSLDLLRKNLNHLIYGLQNNGKAKEKGDQLTSTVVGIVWNGGAWNEPGCKKQHTLTLEKLVKQEEEEEKKNNELKQTLLKKWFTKKEQENPRFFQENNLRTTSQIADYFYNNILPAMLKESEA